MTRADGARAILVAPPSVSAPYWNKLLWASVVPNAAGYYRIRKEPAEVDSDVRGETALSAVDFSLHSQRPCAARCSPLCGSEALFHERPPAGSPADQAERARIHEELAAVGLTLWACRFD